ncbi:hypothetical protein GGX14DRAFT_552383 [Mycena pura]|uniref:PARP catalytic domain-containing protein n=1 Tax=Mycena pura TaxID=153505 RepID=A0AAD6UZ26_9AGAR|nr:hypothetical protein GGX14DRAFT_552383 [Mycena pura]
MCYRSGTPASTNASTWNLCEVKPNCQLRPKFSDRSKTHPYCSKSCAHEAKAKCDFCRVRPKFFDGKKTSPFCSKTCAKNSAAQNPPLESNVKETICLMCKQAPKQRQSHFCDAACADDAEKNGPMILEIPAEHVTFKSGVSWRHAGRNCPPVRWVYKIVASQATQAGYKEYKTMVENAGHFVASGRSPGNEHRRWHGTRRVCNLGDNGRTQFCASTKCSLCCIIKSSFDLNIEGRMGMFGKGIYTSSTSSKSDDYSQNQCSSSFKAILLNKVIVGKGYKLEYYDVSLTAPPAGYDSVLGEKGGSLNYDELVVYTNDAIRPSFLVIYEA